jgi:hypothetical protein
MGNALHPRKVQIGGRFATRALRAAHKDCQALREKRHVRAADDRATRRGERPGLAALGLAASASFHPPPRPAAPFLPTAPPASVPPAPRPQARRSREPLLVPPPPGVRDMFVTAVMSVRSVYSAKPKSTAAASRELGSIRMPVARSCGDDHHDHEQTGDRAARRSPRAPTEATVETGRLLQPTVHARLSLGEVARWDVGEFPLKLRQWLVHEVDPEGFAGWRVVQYSRIGAVR